MSAKKLWLLRLKTAKLVWKCGVQITGTNYSKIHICLNKSWTTYWNVHQQHCYHNMYKPKSHIIPVGVRHNKTEADTSYNEMIIRFIMQRLMKWWVPLVSIWWQRYIILMLRENWKTERYSPVLKPAVRISLSISAL